MKKNDFIEIKGGLFIVLDLIFVIIVQLDFFNELSENAQLTMKIVFIVIVMISIYYISLFFLKIGSPKEYERFLKYKK